jgi:hypothetical protein
MRTMPLSRCLSGLLFTVAAGCSAPANPPAADMGSSADLVAESNVINFSSESYTLKPGEEKYYCYTMRLPADKDVVLTKFVPTYGQGTHHILFSQTLATEPDGFSDCNVLIKTTWLPLYAGGLNSGPLSAPEGAGFKPLAAKNQQLIMQLHLQNATTKDITDKTSMRIEYADPAKITVAAGIFGYDNRTIDLPPMMAGTQTTFSCMMDKKLDVFAVLPHMHKRGKKIELFRGANIGEEKLFEAVWNFDDQPVTPLKVTVNPGDRIHLRCTHDNPTDTTITYGESSDTEMCAAVFYYTPYTSVDGCIN